MKLPSLDGNTDLPPAGPSRPFLCVACNQPHPVGYCPLKLAGVEHCGLCGIAHIGYQRTCPQFSSEAQVTQMLQSLKQSTEPKYLVEQARQYLYGIRKDLVMRRRKAEQRSYVNNMATGSFAPSELMSPGHASVGPYGRWQASTSGPASQVKSQGSHPVAARNYQGAHQDRYYSPLAPPAGAFQPQLTSQVSRPPPTANHPTNTPGLVLGSAPHAHPISVPPWQRWQHSERPQ